MVPDTGPLDAEVIIAGASVAIDRIGPLVLATHLPRGQVRLGRCGPQPGCAGGGKHRARQRRVPRGRDARADAQLERDAGAGAGARFGVPGADTVPIIVYYVHNIPTEPTGVAGRDNWRMRVAMARYPSSQ